MKGNEESDKTTRDLITNQTNGTFHLETIRDVKKNTNLYYRNL